MCYMVPLALGMLDSLIFVHVIGMQFYRLLQGCNQDGNLDKAYDERICNGECEEIKLQLERNNLKRIVSIG